VKGPFRRDGKYKGPFARSVLDKTRLAVSGMELHDVCWTEHFAASREEEKNAAPSRAAVQPSVANWRCKRSRPSSCKGPGSTKCPRKGRKAKSLGARRCVHHEKVVAEGVTSPRDKKSWRGRASLQKQNLRYRGGKKQKPRDPRSSPIQARKENKFQGTHRRKPALIRRAKLRLLLADSAKNFIPKGTAWESCGYRVRAFFMGVQREKKKGPSSAEQNPPFKRGSIPWTRNIPPKSKTLSDEVPALRCARRANGTWC